MNIIIRITIMIGLTASLSCNGKFTFFVKKGYEKFKMFSSRRLSRKSKSSHTTNDKSTVKKKGSLLTRPTPIFEISPEELYEQELEQALLHLQQNNTTAIQDHKTVSAALADILLVDRKKIDKLLPTPLSINEQDKYTQLIQFVIYAWCVKNQGVPENLFVNIVDISWPENRGSENEKKIYTLVHELAAWTAQQYLKDTLNKKDTRKCLANILEQDYHELQTISQDRTQSSTKKRSNT